MTDYFADLNDIATVPWKDDMHESRKSEREELSLIKDLKRRRNYETPDYQELLLRGDNLVFVYDSLQVGGQDYDILNGAKYLGEGVTLADTFVMRNAEGIPVAKDLGTDESCPVKGKVTGDVFAVSALMMLELDRMKGNRTLFTRQERFITLLDQEYKLSQGRTGRPNTKCWMYTVPREDKTYDGFWLTSSRQRLRGDGLSSRIYFWDTTNRRALAS